MSEAKRWCFTLNNYLEEEFKSFEGLEWSYLVIGREKGAEGTPHLQGYIELKNKKKLTALKKFNPRIHWEKLKGKPWQAANYCKKDGDFQEWGEISMKEKPGKKDEDFSFTVGNFLTGGMRRVLASPPTMTRIRVLEKWATYLEPSRLEKPYVHWIWGASGTGKSRQAAEYPDCYWKDDTKWWDGYDGHETIVLDDFRGSQMKFTYLLRLLDRYPMRVETKGGYRQLNSKNIVITSIVHPTQSYAGIQEEEPIRQLERRIDKITETNNKNILGDDVIFSSSDTKSMGNTKPCFSSDKDKYEIDWDWFNAQPAPPELI